MVMIDALAAIAIIATGACLAVVGVFWWLMRKGDK